MKRLSGFILLFFLLTVSLTLKSQEIVIPDENWRLWVDTAASWENDILYLPNEFEIGNLQANPPTIGWKNLDKNTGIPVSLPSTVEEHFWGVFHHMPYKNAYTYEGNDKDVFDGSYRGVSWWYKPVFVPKEMEGKQFTFRLRSARLRAEIYVNQKLAGYHLIGETSYSCDVTNFIKPGEENQIAIRITNPGGRFDWNDTWYMNWGDYEFHASHGFGGLDRGNVLIAHDNVYLDDLFFANNPDENRLSLYASLVNKTGIVRDTEVKVEIINREGRILLTKKEKIKLQPGITKYQRKDIVLENARLWSVDSPLLYNARVSLITGEEKDSREQKIAFRWFDAEGIGDNAFLSLNHQRIRLISAISWSFWAYNGLWPVPELALKEVQMAKKLGLNCLHFHRNVGRTDVLEAQDSLGLLRYMEPGGGFSALGKKYSVGSFNEIPEKRINPDISGKGGVAVSFAEKYMEEKLIRMIRDHRRHPSMIMYSIQNEVSPDMSNPRIYYLLRKMHNEDPSRIIVLKSGVPGINQAWMKPYDDSIYHDSGDGFSGWWDIHTVGGPGVWKDSYYVNSTEFTHSAEVKDEIMVWGEMFGVASPDQHGLMIENIMSKSGASYDLTDHLEIDSAYQQFIEKWEFDNIWGSTDELFREAGKKSYDLWQNVLETSRLSDENDMLVINGWESTSIENHSGIVDNQRNPKSDPDILRQGTIKEKPVVRMSSTVYQKGKSAFFDLWYLNEKDERNEDNLYVFVKTPEGNKKEAGIFSVPGKEENRFSFLIQENIEFDRISETGEYRILVENKEGEILEAESFLVIDTSIPHDIIDKRIGVVSGDFELINYLKEECGLNAEEFNKRKSYDILVESRNFGKRNYAVVNNQIINTQDQPLYRSEQFGKQEMKFTFGGLKDGEAEVSLKFAEVYSKSPGERIFDVALNNQLVLDDFDLFAEGAENRALDKSFRTIVKDGKIRISFPEVKKGNAKICAIKIITEDSIIAVNVGGESYTDKEGLIWKPYRDKAYMNPDLLKQVKKGSPLIILAPSVGSVDIYGQILDEEGLVEYKGFTGNARQSWMGSWVFIKEHPVFKDLPSNRLMSSFYQVGANDASGILLNGDVEVFAGFGRDHDRNVGVSAFSTPAEKGLILFHSCYGLSGVEGPDGPGMHPLMRKKILLNTFQYALDQKDEN